ncbi:MAG: hypothetical protein AAFQ20_00140 [Bacteroidota bacterium]
MLNIKLLLPCFLLLTLISQAQDLYGEWRVLKSENSIGQQSSILKIESNNIHVYDFDRLLFEHDTHFLDALTIQVGDTTLLEFEFIDGNRDFMKIKAVDGKPTDNLKYVRILPTTGHENQLSNFKASTVALKLKDNTLIFPLDKKLKSEDLLISYSAAITSDSVSIRKRENTHFLKFYLKGKVTNIIPIREINEKKLVLYGVPGHQGEVYLFIKT